MKIEKTKLAWKVELPFQHHGTSALHAAMDDDIDRAVSIIERFQEIPETAIPPAVLRDAKGLVILTMTKAGSL